MSSLRNTHKHSYFPQKTRHTGVPSMPSFVFYYSIIFLFYQCNYSRHGNHFVKAITLIRTTTFINYNYFVPSLASKEYFSV